MPGVHALLQSRGDVLAGTAIAMKPCSSATEPS
jgi:hypothetical protein